MNKRTHCGSQQMRTSCARGVARHSEAADTNKKKELNTVQM